MFFIAFVILTNLHNISWGAPLSVVLSEFTGLILGSIMGFVVFFTAVRLGLISMFFFTAGVLYVYNVYGIDSFILPLPHF